MADKIRKKHKTATVKLSRRLSRTITLILTFVMAVIIFATYTGLDWVNLGYAAVRMFFAEREIEEAYITGDKNFISLMDSVERESEVTIEIYTKDGDFVYSSSYKGEMSTPPYKQDIIIIPDTEKKNYTVTTDLGSTTYNEFNLSVDTASSQKNATYLVGTWHTESGVTIKLFKLKSAVDLNTKITIIFISSVAMLVLIAALLITSKLVKQTTKPLEEMSRITKNMAKLNFSQKCETNNIVEISELSDSINEMSESLENALLDLQQKNKKLQDDIEQEKTIDQLRQVFISGVSHEMKTPIAIIQGYAEGLKIFLESDPEMAAKYCDTIIAETDRMNNLVMKLLEIIKYESGEYQILSEAFNLREIIDSWFDRNSEILKEKGITIENHIDSGIVAYGDTFIIPTVVNNYMSNAVSHVSGEMLIRASARKIDGNCYRVSIFNSGTPIAPKDIDHIWDSFYRADKAMSRSQGRFGLGLAIVAAIQKLHKQDYGVINHEDGVEFWFDVEKYEAQL
ncbi:MAG: hypothetical protein IJZ35_02305 [Clostridia bacterium]|nr:hypothetical protein [Clostridia bacterium]